MARGYEFYLVKLISVYFPVEHSCLYSSRGGGRGGGRCWIASRSAHQWIQVFPRCHEQLTIHAQTGAHSDLITGTRHAFWGQNDDTADIRFSTVQSPRYWVSGYCTCDVQCDFWCDVQCVFWCDVQCVFWCDFAYKTRLILPCTNTFFVKHCVDWKGSYHIIWRHPSFQFLLTWRKFVAALRD